MIGDGKEGDGIEIALIDLPEHSLRALEVIRPFMLDHVHESQVRTADTVPNRSLGYLGLSDCRHYFPRQLSEHCNEVPAQALQNSDLASSVTN